VRYEFKALGQRRHQALDIFPPNAVDQATEAQRILASHERQEHQFPRTESHVSRGVLGTRLQAVALDVNAAHRDRLHAHDHAEDAGLARPIPSQQANALETGKRCCDFFTFILK